MYFLYIYFTWLLIRIINLFVLTEIKILPLYINIIIWIGGFISNNNRRVISKIPYLRETIKI